MALPAALHGLSREEAQAVLEQAVIVEVKKKLSRSIYDFISMFVKIEERDATEETAEITDDGIAVPFCLWPGQVQALRTVLQNRLSIVLKARQLGLTWLALAIASWGLVFRPGYSVVALSKKEIPDAKELVRRMRFILRHLPKWLIRQKGKKEDMTGWSGPVWEAGALTVTIQHPGREPSTFQSFSAAPDSGRSFTANLVILDEWAYQQYAEEIWDSAFPIINRPDGGRVIGLSSGKKGTFFEEIWTSALTGTNSFKPIFLNVWTDPRRDRKWFEETKRNMPNTWRREYPEKWQDAFTAGEEAFFQEWDEKIHVPLQHWEPPNDPGYKIIGAYDPGFSRSCFKWYAISPNGRIVCFREYYPSRVIDPDQAEEILRRSTYEDGAPFVFDYIVADTNAWVPSRDTGKSTAEIFAEYGIYLQQASRALETGWRRLHQWLKPIPTKTGEGLTALLVFTRDCKNTIATYPACEESETNPEDISKKTEHHCQDCDRYIVMSRPEPAVIKKSKIDELAEEWGKDSPEYKLYREWVEDEIEHEVDPDELIDM